MKRDPKKDESADAAQIKEDESVDEYAQDDDIDENTGKFNCTAKKKKRWWIWSLFLIILKNDLILKNGQIS